MLRRKWLISVISVISLIIIIVGVGILIVKPFRHIPERDPYFIVIILTLAEGGPVIDDMEKRGVYTRIEEDGVLIGENIKVGEIHKLIDEGVYVVDEQRHVLVFGPNYRPPP